MRSAAAAAAATLAVSAVASVAAAEALPRLTPGSTIDIACDSKSVVVATNAADATNGGFRLRLDAGSAADGSGGRWSVVSADAAHRGSLALMQAKPCATGCPLVVGDSDIQLWAPSPKGIDTLGADELLMLAVLKSADMTFKASTFRGQQIEALESGTCSLAPETAKPPAAEPATAADPKSAAPEKAPEATK